MAGRVLGVCAAVLLALAAGDARAADGAAFNPIGYSPDSRYFAFEQYGIQDGSGFPYWEIFVIDLKTDQWAKDTPVRKVAEDENASLAAPRGEATAAVLPILKALDISVPAELLAANPATEVVTDRARISFDRWYVPGGSSPERRGPEVIRHGLALETLALDAPADCYPEDGPYLGFRLTITDVAMDQARVLHADDTIPASRHCPTGYDLAAVVAPAGYPVTDRLVAIIGIYARGFEGADHRFIAVPFTISD
jgi:predicted secreted protein